MRIDSRHYYYWIIPVILGTTLVAMYFSGISWMQTFVAPKVNREFGALENIQNLIILSILAVAFKGFLRKTLQAEKIIFAGVALAALFLFLEEIDYGLHYLEYFRGETIHTEIRNIHNINGTRFVEFLAPIVYSVLAVFFCILPLAARNSSRLWLRYLTPQAHSIGTIVAMVLVAQLAFLLDRMDLPSNLSLRENISEFGEGFLHYTFFLYFYEIACKRKTPPLPWATKQ